jgi:hypothetical protein
MFLCKDFESFDDAEYYLAGYLDLMSLLSEDYSYETDREEYFIQEKE